MWNFTSDRYGPFHKANIYLTSLKIHLVAGIDGSLPFSLDDASRPETEIENSETPWNRVLLDTRLNNRVLDLRVWSYHSDISTILSYLQTQTNQAVFKLQAVIGRLFRDYLGINGFTEIYSPKLQGTATEPGASVFKVSYFKGIGTSSTPIILSRMFLGIAYLAQSPQLAKQMAIAADFERVYEIGPVFRAEDANAYRHLTEFVGLDLEMTIEEHYHEVVELLDGLFLSLFRNLQEKYKHEIETVRKQFPADEFLWREGPEGTLKLTHREAIQMLIDDGVETGPTEDLK